MKDGKPEREKLNKLIEEYDKWLTSGEDKIYKACGVSEEDKEALYDFVLWLYIFKKYMIVPQEGGEEYEIFYRREN